MTATDMLDAATMTTAMEMEQGSSSLIMLIINNSRNISRDIKMEAIPDNKHGSNSSRRTTMAAMKIMP